MTPLLLIEVATLDGKALVEIIIITKDAIAEMEARQ